MTHKAALATFALVAAVGFGIAGTVIAPAGIIDGSMLYMIAQFLIYSATAVGFGEAVSKIIDAISDFKNNKK